MPCSKFFTENKLFDLADSKFEITCHRFATAGGLNGRLRLDLVLNNFVTGALSTGGIIILSDGTFVIFTPKIIIF